MEHEPMIEMGAPPPGPFDPEAYGLKRAGWGDLLLYLFGGFGVYVFLSLVLGAVLFVMGIEEADIGLGILLISLLLNVVITGGSPVVLGIWRKRLSWALLGLAPPRWNKWYFLAVPGVAALIYFPLNFVGIGFEMWLSGSTDALEARSQMLMLGGPTVGGFLVMLLFVGILVPFAEEFYFRGLLYPWFRQRFDSKVSIVISSLLFGFAHFDSLGAMLQAFLMGAVMAYALERTRSLYVSFVLHASINSASVVMLYFSMAMMEYY